MDTNNLSTQELEKQYLALGGNPTHASFKNKLASLQALSIEQYEHDKQQIESIESKRPKWAKDAGEWAGKGLAYVATIFTFIFVLGGLFFGTGALITAEYLAVYEGFNAISSTHAWLYAFSLVLFSIVVLFIQQIVKDKYGTRPAAKMSLRLLFQDALYFFGIGKLWQKEYSNAPDESRSIDLTVTLLTWAIVIFGLLGRLKDALLEVQGDTWMQGLSNIIFKSNLQEFAGYCAMVIATAALLWANKWVVHFIYAQFKRVTGGVVVQDFSQASIVILSPVERAEAAQRQLLTREIMRLEAKNKKSE